MGSSVFSGLDWAVVAAYFALTAAVAVWASRSQAEQNARDYFLAGRSEGWFVIGSSVFAANIGADHLVGLAGSGASQGLAVAQFEIIGAPCLLLLGWLFAPFYLRSGAYTMPEFLEKRFSRGPRYYLAAVSIVLYVLTKVSVTIAAGGIVFETLMGVNFWMGSLIVILATGAYTLWGGLKAVMYTDMIQMFVMVAGAVVVTILGLRELGGVQALARSVGPSALSLWRPPSDPTYPWTGLIFGLPVIGVWYWCSDQFIVQRTLSANGLSQARRGVVFAGFLKQLPLFLFVLPGLVAAALHAHGRLALGKPDQALPALVAQLLPAGLRGLVGAGLLAGLMGALSAVFNSTATLFTIDVYQRLRPRASERSLVLVGRLSVLGMIVLSLAWIPFMGLVSGQLFTYIQKIQSYISPPVAAVFLGGVLSRRANATGAIWTLVVGGGLGLARLILEMNASRLTGFWRLVVEFNFLHFAFVLFAVCLAILAGVSAITAPPGEEARRLTLSSHSGNAPQSARSWRLDLGLSLALTALIIAIWLIFSPLGIG
jgi:solute:Na+ symporter, SSS family